MTGYNVILERMHADLMLLRQMAAHLELTRVAKIELERQARAWLLYRLRLVLQQRLDRLRSQG